MSEVKTKPVQMDPAQFDMVLEDELDVVPHAKGTCRVWFNYMTNVDESLKRRDWPDIICVTFDLDNGKRIWFDTTDIWDDHMQRIEDAVMEAFDSGEF